MGHTSKLRKVAEKNGVKIYFNPDYEEFVVKIPGKPEADYFTNDRQDALETANLMSLGR